MKLGSIIFIVLVLGTITCISGAAHKKHHEKDHHGKHHHHGKNHHLGEHHHHGKNHHHGEHHHHGKAHHHGKNHPHGEHHLHNKDHHHGEHHHHDRDHHHNKDHHHGEHHHHGKNHHHGEHHHHNKHHGESKNMHHELTNHHKAMRDQDGGVFGIVNSLINGVVGTPAPGNVPPVNPNQDDNQDVVVDDAEDIPPPESDDQDVDEDDEGDVDIPPSETDIDDIVVNDQDVPVVDGDDTNRPQLFIPLGDHVPNEILKEFVNEANELDVNKVLDSGVDISTLGLPEDIIATINILTSEIPTPEIPGIENDISFPQISNIPINEGVEQIPEISNDV